MYNIVYDEMVGAKVAMKLETPVFMNRKGDQVDESQRFGKEVDTQLTHPNYVLFGDKTGCNTSMKKDSHIAGTKYITKRGTRAQRMASTSEGRFTVLPIIASRGEPVCCIVIFQSKLSEPKVEWGMGIDIKVDLVRDLKGDIDVIASSGPGKYYPGGPQCVFNGKTIHCLTYCSESGGITTKILIKILKYFDTNNVFPRYPGGPIPFLLVNGHNTRLDPLFIDYINDSSHWWKVCLGVPYATSLWQVGDSSENNGTFKTEWYRLKDKLLLHKYNLGMNRTIMNYDVIPLLNRVFEKSFGQKEVNMHAISDREWGPLNRKLVEHPSLNPDKTADQAYSPVPVDISALNIKNSEGMAASVLDRIERERVKNKGKKRQQKSNSPLAKQFGRTSRMQSKFLLAFWLAMVSSRLTIQTLSWPSRTVRTKRRQKNMRRFAKRES